jgi:hypothetical protein
VDRYRDGATPYDAEFALIGERDREVVGGPGSTRGSLLELT